MAGACRNRTYQSPCDDLSDFEVRVGSWYKGSRFNNERLSWKKRRDARRVSSDASLYQERLGDT